MDSVRNLSHALPLRDFDAAEELQSSFRAAALEITTLYRKASENGKRAYQSGYLAGLQDVLDFVQSTQIEESSGSQSAIRNLESLIEYIERRSESLRGAGSDSGDDVASNAGPSSARGGSAQPTAASSRGRPDTKATSTAPADATDPARRPSPPAHTARCGSEQSEPVTSPTTELSRPSHAPAPPSTTAVAVSSSTLPPSSPAEAEAALSNPAASMFPLPAFPFTFNPFEAAITSATESRGCGGERSGGPRSAHRKRHGNRKDKGRLAPAERFPLATPPSIESSSAGVGYNHYVPVTVLSDVQGGKRKHDAVVSPTRSGTANSGRAGPSVRREGLRNAPGDTLMEEAEAEERPSKRLPRHS